MSNSKTVDFEPSYQRPVSDAQLNANRANSQHSTGPRSDEGKAKSSLNAIQTGLTGRTILLPTDDADAYQQHVNRIFEDLSPVTDKERVIVQTVADTDWRLLRIAPLEASVWAMGFRKLADLYPEETNEATRTSLIQGEVFAFFRRDFSNVALQERRLRNQRLSDLAELKALQQERAEKAKEAAEHSQNEMRRANKIVDNARHSKTSSPSLNLASNFHSMNSSPTTPAICATVSSPNALWPSPPSSPPTERSKKPPKPSPPTLLSHLANPKCVGGAGGFARRFRLRKPICHPSMK